MNYQNLGLCYLPKPNLVVKQIQTCTIVPMSCSNFPAKSLVLQRQHLKEVGGSVAVVISQTNSHHFPKNMAKLLSILG